MKKTWKWAAAILLSALILLAGFSVKAEIREGSCGENATNGYNTATLKIPATTGRNGYQYRCVVTDEAGNVVYSSAATLTVK